VSLTTKCDEDLQQKKKSSGWRFAKVMRNFIELVMILVDLVFEDDFDEKWK
jgi:hypothetical protein